MRRIRMLPAILACALVSTFLMLVAQSSYIPSAVFNAGTAPPTPMSVVRNGASSGVLSDGRVLISGGNDASGTPHTSVEFLGSGASAGTMTMPRSGHISVALKDDTVLLAGGTTTGGAVTNAAEIFNPATGASTAIASLLVARAGATATLLSDGRVLIAGGKGSGSPLQTMEIFDPASVQFSNAAPMTVARQNHAAALLGDGRVLLVGGSDGANPLASVEVYDPVANSVSALPNMSTARAGLSATTMLKGKVLLAGGGSASTEILDPVAGSISPGPSMTVARTGHLALLLPNNNTVLMVAGSDSAAAEIFVPWAANWHGAFAAFGIMANPRTGASSGASGQSGIAFVAGGQVSGTASNTVDVVRFPMVKTDKEDYVPGETVTITGSGFQPGETVNLVLEEVPYLDTHGPYQTVAGADGNFSATQFAVDAEDANIRFYLSATGATSGLTAGKTFTDSVGFNNLTVGGQSPNVVPSTGVASYLLTIGFNNSGGSCTVGTFTTGALPSGASKTFSPTSVTSTGADQTVTMTVTTTGVTPGNYNNIDVSATGTGCGGTITKKFALTVGAATTLTLSPPSPGLVTLGSNGPVTLTATLTQTSGGAIVGGAQTITFNVDGTSVGTATTSSGVATLSYNPATLPAGPHSFTASYSGGQNAGTNFGASTSGTQTLTVAAANTAPTADGKSPTVLEDAVNAPIALSGSDTDSTSLTFSIVSSSSHGSLGSIGSVVCTPSAGGTSCTASVPYSPAANYNGPDSFTYRVNDGTSNSTTASVVINLTAVNDAPTITLAADPTVLEDAAAQSVSGFATGISPGPANESTQVLTLTVTNNNNGLFSAQPSIDKTTGTLTYTPAANANGSATITVELKDDGGTANSGVDTTTKTFVINVTAVNDAPSFTKGADVTVLEDAAAQSVAGWATAISAGPANESGQTLTFNVTGNTNSALFSVQPAVAANGTLSFTAAANANGTATITINLQDNGGTANSGVDTSATQTFVINLTAVNDAPTITLGADPTVLEDAAAQSVSGFATGISPGPANESTQVLTLTVTNNNNGLFSAQPSIDKTTGTLTYTPAANANGSATITVELKDDGGTANSGVDTTTKTFVINVTAVNDAPSFTKGADVTVLEDAAAQSVAGWATAISAGPANESGQTLTFNVTGNTNSALFSAGPAISSTGTLTFTPAANANGTATVTISLQDSGGTANGGVDTSATQTFVINLTAVNDAPTITLAADPTVLEDAAAQSVSGFATGISPGPANESTQALTLTVTNNNNSLFSAQPSIDKTTGTLTYTPAANANGSATITVELKDDGGTANSGVDTTTKTFVINVTAVNDAPSFTKGADVTVLEDAAAQSVAGWATAISAGPANESGQTLTFNVTGNTNSALFSVQPAVAANGTLSFTAAANANGTATITINLQDNGGTANSGVDTSATQTFVINLTAVNDAPTITLGGNQSVAEDSGAHTAVSFATGVTRGPSDESGQALTWTVTNNNNALFSSQPVIDAATGTLTYTPAADANGTATVTVKIQDDGGVLNGGVDTVTKTFTITVWEINDAPTASTDSATTDEDTPKTFDPRGNDSKGPANESGQTLTITSITQPSHGTASIVSSGTQINYSPSQDYNGPDSMTYTVCDNGTTNGSQDFKCSTATVNFTVNSVNDAPVVHPLTTSALSILENGSVTISGTFADPDNGDTHTIVINWGDGSSSTLPGLAAGVFAFGPVTHTYLDDNPTGTASDTYPLNVTVRDAGIPAPVMFGSNGVVVTVNNVAPEITGITAPGPSPVGTSVSIVTNFNDPGTTDTFTCIVTWDDAVTSNGTATASATNPKACTASRTFPGAGVFGFSVSITDDDTGSDAETYTGYVVVYDPNGGFVTGGGWITSPAGAYLADLSLSGKANFGFVSKYQKGAKIPTGETEFQYKVGNLNFHSTVYEWLVVAGTKAQYKGSGTINGAGDYGFMLTAVNGSPDTFRMKIWDKSTGNIVYDSGLGGSDDIDTSPNTPLGGGSIVIHK